MSLIVTDFCGRLRIPIGYWAYDKGSAPYLSGADYWLGQAIGWAQTRQMKVWIDLHGSPGSQNGKDHSGHEGDIEWNQGQNRQASLDVLTTIAQKYGTVALADTVVGIEIVNEPDKSLLGFSQQFAQDAYKTIKSAAANPNLMVVTHDAFAGLDKWTTTAQTIGGKGTFGVDAHLYQSFTPSDNQLDQPGHIKQVCNEWVQELKNANDDMMGYVGEWSSTTNIIVNSDGSTAVTNNATSCSTPGCQCSSDPNLNIEQWNDNMVKQVRMFVEVQIQTFEQYSSGYFIWSWGGPGGWGIKNLIDKEAFPNPITNYKYPGLCTNGGSSSR